MRAAFEKEAKAVAAEIAAALDKAERDPDLQAMQILAKLKLQHLMAIYDDIDQVLAIMAADGSLEALQQVAMAEDTSIVELANDRAIEWAGERAAEMVGKRRLSDGSLVENPDAQWRIDDGTREMLRTTVRDAIQEGWSNDRLADAIAENHAFSDARAEMIARTETAFADVQGNLIGYRASGVVAQKQWLTGAGCCDECEALDGVVVGLDEPFPNDGGDGPPLHPQCRCDVAPIVEDPDEAIEAVAKAEEDPQRPLPEGRGHYALSVMEVG